MLLSKDSQKLAFLIYTENLTEIDNQKNPIFSKPIELW